jgi:hypothetical protein
MVVNAFTRVLTRWLRFKRTLSRVAAVAKRFYRLGRTFLGTPGQGRALAVLVHYWYCASPSVGCRCSLAMPHETS